MQHPPSKAERAPCPRTRRASFHTVPGIGRSSEWQCGQDSERAAAADHERPGPGAARGGAGSRLVAGGLYVFGTQHTPDYTTSLFGQTGPDTFKLKSWLATGVLAFAAVQLGLALWMYGRLPWIGVAPPRVGPSTGRSEPLPSC